MDIKAIVTDALETQFRKFGFVPATEQGEKNAAPEEHPVAKAALAAGIDTPQKFASLQAEAKAGQEAIADKREYAKKAAAAYFGQETEEAKEALARAERTVDATSDTVLLSSMGATWLAGAPGADTAGQRLSTAAKPGKTPADQDPQNAEALAAKNEDLNASTIFARRAEQNRQRR